MNIILQKTINNKISCSGIGLHSGAAVSISLFPAKCDSGIIFKRIDLKNTDNVIKADYRNVIEANLGTTIANKSGAKVATIEHLMAAIWGCGIDNLLIEIDGPELPIMDGSSEPFVFLIECSGINIQEQTRRFIEITKTVRFEDGDKFIQVDPAKDFSLDIHIDFDHYQMRNQKFDYHATQTSFKNDISRARTFCFKHEIEHMHKVGLAKGGSLDNAIVVDQDGVINKGGLRYQDEFVRHKTLDFIGDIYLAGFYIMGHFKGSKTGHSINNKMLHKLLGDESAWRLA